MSGFWSHFCHFFVDVDDLFVLYKFIGCQSVFIIAHWDLQPNKNPSHIIALCIPALAGHLCPHGEFSHCYILFIKQICCCCYFLRSHVIYLLSVHNVQADRTHSLHVFSSRKWLIEVVSLNIVKHGQFFSPFLFFFFFCLLSGFILFCLELLLLASWPGKKKYYRLMIRLSK